MDIHSPKHAVELTVQSEHPQAVIKQTAALYTVSTRQATSPWIFGNNQNLKKKKKG
jgi:hypothetical protein